MPKSLGAWHILLSLWFGASRPPGDEPGTIAKQIARAAKAGRLGPGRPKNRKSSILTHQPRSSTTIRPHPQSPQDRPCRLRLWGMSYHVRHARAGRRDSPARQKRNKHIRTIRNIRARIQGQATTMPHNAAMMRAWRPRFPVPARSPRSRPPTTTTPATRRTTASRRRARS